MVMWALIAVVGNDKDSWQAIEQGLQALPVQKAYLLTNKASLLNAGAIGQRLSKNKIAAKVIETDINSIESLFSTVSEIKNSAGDEKLVVNIESDYRTSCLMLSAAFVNGLQAIGILDNEVMAYPIMKFSYYTALSDRKHKLLQIINSETIPSLEFLAKKAGMSLPLATYHVRGTRQKPGLEELGLVETSKNGKKLGVSATPLGKLMAKGYIDQCRECPSPARLINTGVPMRL